MCLLGLLGLRIFETVGATIDDLGEEHGHRVLRVHGNGGNVVLVPLPPAVSRAVDRAAQQRPVGRCCSTAGKYGGIGTLPRGGCGTLRQMQASGCRGCTVTPSSPPCSTPVSTRVTLRSPPGTLIR